MANIRPQLGETFGMEIETGDISRSQVRNSPELRELGFTDAHDASIESYSYRMNGFSVAELPPQLRRRANLERNVVGAEIVSPILNIENSLDIFKLITRWVSTNGETPKNNRCGIHFHISMSHNLKILKTATALSRHLEDVFFRIAGMGYEYRGQSNDSIYARPITKKGPVCVNYGGRKYATPIFDLDSLMDSKSTEEFWTRYGDVRGVHGNGGRYQPIRYHWINFYPMYYQDTLEFRVFNTSTNPHYLWATLELCRAFCKYVIKNENKSDFEEHSVYDNRSTEDIIKTLTDFASASKLSTYALEFLLNIIESTPPVRMNNEWVWTHLRNYTNPWRNVDYVPNKVDMDEIKRPTFTDIHNIENQQRQQEQQSSNNIGNSTMSFSTVETSATNIEEANVRLDRASREISRNLETLISGSIEPLENRIPEFTNVIEFQSQENHDVTVLIDAINEEATITYQDGEEEYHSLEFIEDIEDLLSTLRVLEFDVEVIDGYISRLIQARFD